MSNFEKYTLKRDFELGIVNEENLPKSLVKELKELYIKQAYNYLNEYSFLKRKYELLKMKEVKNTK